MDDYIDLEIFRDDAAAAYPTNRLYCLADHAGMPGLHAELLGSRWPWKSLFAASQEEAALKVAPLLFALSDDEGKKIYRHFLEWVAVHGTYTSSMLMLSSPLALDELALRLARRMQARVPENMDVLLRYFDPRVFEALLVALTEHQRTQFLGVADCWWYPNRSGELVRQLATYNANDDFESPLLLSAPQEFALLDASEVDLVAQQLQLTAPDEYARMGAPQRHVFLRRHMAAATTAGIVATHEVALYCSLALLYGEDFALASPWTEILINVRAGTSFSVAVASADT